MHRHRTLLRRLPSILLCAIAAASTASVAQARYPGNCDGLAAVTQVGRVAFVRAQGTLERLENGAFVPFATATWSGHANAASELLISASWSTTPQSGEFRAQLELSVWDGVEEAAPSDQFLAARPASSIVSSVEMGTRFTCGTDAPQLSSSAIDAVLAGANYTYAPLVSHSGPGLLSFSLASAPRDMHVDDTTGTLTWSAPSSPGHYNIILIVQDLATGLFDAQAFELSVN